MQTCPRCQLQSPRGMSPCPRCGWNFQAPQVAPQQAVPAEPKRRGRTLALVLGACGGAAILGVAVALVLNFVVLDDPSSSTQPPVIPGTPSGVGAPATSPAGLPTPDTSPTPAATPTPTPTPKPDFPAVADKVRSGVVRVLASTCGGTGIGTGFLVDANTVATAYATVAQAVSTVVLVDSEPVPATVISADASRGVALLGLDRPATGHTFAVRKTQFAVGDAVGLVGLPRSSADPQLIESKVARTGIKADHQGGTVSGLVQLDGRSDAGLAGAPLLDADGAAIGMMFAPAGQPARLVLPGALIEPAISTSSKAPRGGRCAEPKGPAGETSIRGEGSAAVKNVFRSYFGGINSADYAQAYRTLAPSLTNGTTLAETAKGWVSTYDFNIEVKSSGGKRAATTAWVTFDSIFKEGLGPDGTQTCARWSIDYSLTPTGNGLRLSGVTAHDGNEFFTPC